MGMAASQARLLTITARLADNELRSQTINNAKMRLATQSSQASENYINALNNATLRFASYDEAGNAMSQDLTYNALTAYSSYNTQYGLINSAGQILVSESEAAMFTQANGNLNAYLLAHGLEYTTTYFDELGAIKNSVYPEPFNNIQVEEMKTYYEQYGSYENSLEVEEYQLNYSEFAKAETQLIKASESSLEEYLLYGANTPKINYDSANKKYSIELSNLLVTAEQKISAFKSYFLAENSDDTYNLNNLINVGILSNETAKDVQEIVGSIEYASNAKYLDSDGKPVIGNDLKRATTVGIYDVEQVSFTAVKNDDDNTVVYTLDDDVQVTVGADGKVVSVAPYEDPNNNDQTITLSGPLDAVGGIDFANKTFEELMKELSYIVTETEDDGTNTYTEHFLSIAKDNDGNYVKDEDGNYKFQSRTLIQEADLKEYMDSVVEEIIKEIKDLANYENFADGILNGTITQVKMDSVIPTVGKTLEDVVDGYKEAKNSFLNNIFQDDTYENAEVTVDVDGVKYTFASTKAYIEEALKNGWGYTDPKTEAKKIVTPENLTDIDFILQLIYYNNLNGANLRQSDSFNTVIKEFLVEQMIAVYGEPKYAWVDKNDTANTGNADAKAQWYTNLFNRMNQGFKALENGLGASKEWLEYAFESGIVTLEQVDKNYKWNGLDYRTCVKITEETDEAAVAKAEAEYNRAMNDIEAKDNIFDMELKNIDTEHNALQTEYDVIKGVIDKNISRTFKFNQSA